MVDDGERQADVHEEFRPLTDREREILDMLLSVEIQGIDELRAQAAHVLAARWSCGCASFDLTVDRTQAPASSVVVTPAVEAFTKDREGVNVAFDLLLWLDDGWLSGVEIVDYVEHHGVDSPDEIPPPEAWQKPEPRSSAV